MCQWSTSRRTAAGVSLGISIGVAGTLIVLGIEEEESRKGRPFALPADYNPSKPKALVEHEALRYGMPSNSNVFVRSGYVVSFDYRYCSRCNRTKRTI